LTSFLLCPGQYRTGLCICLQNIKYSFCWRAWGHLIFWRGDVLHLTLIPSPPILADIEAISTDCKSRTTILLKLEMGFSYLQAFYFDLKGNNPSQTSYFHSPYNLRTPRSRVSISVSIGDLLLQTKSSFRILLHGPPSFKKGSNLKIMGLLGLRSLFLDMTSYGTNW
jgi:hypothetical protein